MRRRSLIIKVAIAQYLKRFRWLDIEIDNMFEINVIRQTAYLDTLHDRRQRNNRKQWQSQHQ